MPVGEVKLSEELGVNRRTIRNHAKKLGKDVGKLTEAETKEIKDKVNKSKEIVNTNLGKIDELKEKSTKFKSQVRRIDKYDYSSILDILQDAKERYVANENIIQRLQFEIDNFDVLLVGQTNGATTAIPQLPAIEKFIKLNIALRNQILEIEEKLGRNAETNSDPFN